MKIAVSGKGGVGKSTVAAALALMLARRGQRVLALDADPDANLAAALGMDEAARQAIVPISRRIELIEERTGAKVEEYGKVFKLNPEVSDVAEKFGTRWGGLNIVVLGAVQKGGSGCACPESTFLRALVADMVLYKNDTLIMDMEAGIEHLGRATSHGVDVMLVVAEPGRRAVDCARTVVRMAGEIGVKRLLLVANKVASKADEDYLRGELPDLPLAAVIPYSESLRASDRDGVSVLDGADNDVLARFEELLHAVTLPEKP